MIDSKQIKPGNSGQKLKTINGVTVWTKDNTPILNVGQSASYATVGHDDTMLTMAYSPADSLIRVTVNGIGVRLGHGDRTKDCYFASEHPFTRLGSSNGVLFALKNLRIWAWGVDGGGQLGDNTVTAKSSPISVVGEHAFIAIGTSSGTTLGLKSDGGAWTWGTGTSGELGDSTATSKSSPVSVVGAHSFISIAGQASTNGALKTDGSAWTWGAGASGTLGDNTATAKSSPVSVVGAHIFIQLAGGKSNFYALKSDGSAWAWGVGTSGALGDNTATAKSSPVSIVGGHIFSLIAGGVGNSNHAAAIKSSNGSAWCWGEAASGGLGDNQVAANRSSPVSVVGAHSFTSISAATNYTTGLKADGSVWSWGLGTDGQLGDNTATSKSSPVSVVGGHSFIALKAVATNVMALKNDGSIWSWGLGTNALLGDNTTTSKSSPVSVVGHPANIVRLLTDITVNDVFIWNGSAAGQNLKTTDNIDFNYAI